MDIINLNRRYSTTRMLTKVPPTGKSDSLYLSSHPEQVYQGGLRTQGYFKQNYQDKPLLSIITVVFNSQNYLEQTIVGVLCQSYSNIEYIVIDGASTDSSLDIVKKYEEQIDYIVSEPDKGISDAFNKGVKAASGDYYLFLNADDFLVSKDSIQNAFDILNPKASVHWFRTGFLTMNDRRVYSFNYAFSKRSLYYLRTYPQPSTIYRHTVFEQVGDFSLDLKNTMDTEFLIRCATQGVVIVSYPMVISLMRLGGISGSNIETTIREGYQIRKKHLGTIPALIFTIIRRAKQEVKNSIRYAKNWL